MKFKFFIAVLLVMNSIDFSGTLSAMEAPQESNLFEKFKTQGPLNTLGFQLVEIKSPTYIVGWLQVPASDALMLGPDLPESIWVGVQLHDNGYSVEYLDATGKKLPKGLYLWRSSNQVQALSPDGPVYIYKDLAWRNEKTDKVWKEHRFELIRKIIDPRQEFRDIYSSLPSFSKAFGGPYTVFVENMPPRTLFIGERQLAILDNLKEWIYNELTEDQKQQLLSVFLPQERAIFTHWLKDKMQGTGLSSAEQDEIVKQYLVELVLGRTIQKRIKKRSTGAIDTYDELANIEAIQACMPEMRKEFNAALEQETEEHRKTGLTAYAKITCIGGMYQWD